ncbi:LmeA family phospholipid-binding protein [Corynebacterium rhinophilum]|uniref:LmeA family phospholipid-binding protein n=1 Tax=Corynebacterium rhinophilum TaxID=3050197 RepID=UPI00254BF34F|nr:DUF2993 domain-containing protein [Corynebacterium sp. MSK192]MDK8698866.1 DUF2993 domain-containing protein [Corynebacterium sp. MSK192]
MSVVKVDRRIVHVLILVGVVFAGWVADACVAMHSEHKIAQEVKENSRLENSPQVYIGGTPYLLAAGSKEIPYLQVKALDVEVPKLGMVNASTVLRDITVTPEQVVNGDIEGAPVSTYSRGISLDGVALGRLLGITDLSIANPDDISPSGGVSAEAKLTGTLPGDKEKSTAMVTLRLVGPEFRMEVYGTDDPRLKEAFSLNFDTRELPLPAQATMVRLQGGTIYFEVQRRNIKVQMAQLSPLEIEGSEQRAVEEAEKKAADTANKVGPAPDEDES